LLVARATVSWAGTYRSFVGCTCNGKLGRYVSIVCRNGALKGNSRAPIIHTHAHARTRTHARTHAHTHTRTHVHACMHARGIWVLSNLLTNQGCGRPYWSRAGYQNTCDSASHVYVPVTYMYISVCICIRIPAISPVTGRAGLGFGV